MGNEASVEMDCSGVMLERQDEDHLWSLSLLPGSETLEGTCVFCRKPGTGAEADLCKTAVEVSRCHVLVDISYHFLVHMIDMCRPL